MKLENYLFITVKSQRTEVKKSYSLEFDSKTVFIKPKIHAYHVFK